MKPIIFNAEMVKAILDGRKTQTRIVLKGCDTFNIEETEYGFNLIHNYKMNIENVGLFSSKEILFNWFQSKYSKYKKDDILWVREPAKIINSTDDLYMEFVYLADNKKSKIEYPSRFAIELPKWIFKCQGVPNGCIKEMARIFLKVTNVRVERLQDISDKDCIKEGISEVGFYPDEGFPLCSGYMIGKDDGKTALANNPQKPFGELWNSTAKDGYKWEDNPFVFCYEFERVKQ